jgi:hypothetical protein
MRLMYDLKETALHSSFDKKVVSIASNLEESTRGTRGKAELEGKLKYYESINVWQIVNELTEKARILEEMITEKQGLEKELKSLGFGHLVGYIKPKLRRPHTAMRFWPGTSSTRQKMEKSTTRRCDSPKRTRNKASLSRG